MVLKLRVIPYAMSSSSARHLARALDCLRVSRTSDTYKYRRNTCIINWGCSHVDTISTIPSESFINHPSAVRRASNKLNSFRAFASADVSCPEWTVDKDVAVEWLRSDDTVYCRKELQGKSGSGIIIAEDIDSLVDAPLYTKRANTSKEYRVHVFDGEVIDYVKKARRRNAEERASHLIRSYSKGWVFVREGIELPEVCREEAIKAVAALGLDFGAVDVALIKDDERQAVVFEVNTACGMDAGSTTLKSYVNAIKRRYIRWI